MAFREGMAMKLHRIILVMLLSSLFFNLLFTHSSAADDKYVILEVEGVGTDRTSAMANAWLEGIRQAAGSFIDAKTEMNNEQITERIISYSRAGEGLYFLKLRMWIVKDILRDGAKHATAGSAEISFSASGLKRKVQTAPELLEAMLARYNPENFLSCYIPGKPEVMQGKQDTFRLNVEISFNEKLYHEAFVPDPK